jgi:hypothetical protein
MNGQLSMRTIGAASIRRTRRATPAASGQGRWRLGERGTEMMISPLMPTTRAQQRYNDCPTDSHLLGRVAPKQPHQADVHGALGHEVDGLILQDAKQATILSEQGVSVGGGDFTKRKQGTQPQGSQCLHPRDARRSQLRQRTMMILRTRLMGTSMGRIQSEKS